MKLQVILLCFPSLCLLILDHSWTKLWELCFRAQIPNVCTVLLMWKVEYFRMSAVSCLKEKREAAEGIAKLMVPGLAQSLGSSNATEEAACKETVSCLTSET